MKDRIRLSNYGSFYLSRVKQNLKMGGQPNYVPMRIALGRSLQSGKDPIFQESNTEVLEKIKSTPNGGEQPSINTFEQDPLQGLVFRALLTQRYNRKIDGDEYVDKLVAHIEHGLHLIFHESDRISGYDYLITVAKAASNHAKNTTIYTQQNNYASEGHKLVVEIGKTSHKGEAVNCVLNIAPTKNPHFAVMGGSGSGKTFFLKHLLSEIRKNSNYETHFIVFDYKDGDFTKADFIEKTNAEVLDVKKQPLPLNIFVGAKTDQEQREQAEKIIQIVKSADGKIGDVQAQNLYDAIIQAYQECRPYPDWEQVRDILKRNVPKTDSLASLLRPIVEQNYFVTADKVIYGQWTNKTLVVDIHNIANKEMVCFFVLQQIYDELKKLGEAPVNRETGARQIRTVVVIDEAHHFLGEKRRSEILIKMIREIRSMGGMVVLASQSPDDYDQSEFDYLELMEFPIVMGGTYKSHRFIERKFGITTAQAKSALSDLTKFEPGEAFALHNGKMEKVKVG